MTAMWTDGIGGVIAPGSTLWTLLDHHLGTLMIAVAAVIVACIIR